MIVLPGCWACFVFLEQRVHHVSDWGKQSSYHAHHVPRALSHLQGALEPDHCGPRIQRTQNLHGNELKAVWWPHCFIQGWKAKVSLAFLIGWRFLASLFLACRSHVRQWMKARLRKQLRMWCKEFFRIENVTRGFSYPD